MKAPEITTGFWFDDEHVARLAHGTELDDTEGEQQALDHLAECVNAARSVY